MKFVLPFIDRKDELLKLIADKCGTFVLVTPVGDGDIYMSENQLTMLWKYFADVKETVIKKWDNGKISMYICTNSAPPSQV